MPGRAHEGAAAGAGRGAGDVRGGRRRLAHAAARPPPARPAGARRAVRGRPAQGASTGCSRASRTATCRPSPCPTRPTSRRRERIAIDYEDGKELVERLQKAQKALATDAPATWKAFQAQGVFRGSGPAPGKIAFLFTGQGSQYVNMGRDLAAADPLVAGVFEEADRVLEPILGRKLTSYIFVDRQDPEAVKQAEEDLKQTAITQPAVLTMDTAMCRLLGEFGFEPDMVMGHSLGEYGALVAAGVLTFAEALEAAAARGREMSKVSFGDNGAMAAVMAPADFVRRGAEGDRRLRGAREPQRARPGRDRRRDGGGGAGRRRLQQEGLPGAAPPGEPRLPHEDRRAGGGAAAQGARPASTCGRPRLPLVGNVTARLLPVGARGHQGPALPPDRLARALGRGRRAALRRGRAGLRRGRPEAGAQGLRGRRAGRQDAT